MKKFISTILIFCIIMNLCGCADFSNILKAFSQSKTSSKDVNASQEKTEESVPVINSDPVPPVESSKVMQSITEESSLEESDTETESEEKPSNFDIKLSFVGDVMLACLKNETTKGSFNEYVDKNTPDYFLKKVHSVFANDDFTTVNLENVLTDNELEETEKNHDPAYWFRSKTDNTKIILEGSVEGVSLANNHTRDYGKEGYQDTIDAVKNAGLNYGSFEEIMYYEKNGFKIAVICYGLWRANGVPIIRNLIKRAEKQSDYQIVFFHGGEERIYEPEEWKIEACHELVDSGADLIIGNHPHVLQPREIYKDTEIIYSLGNFCFGGNKKPDKNTIIYQMKLTVNTETLKLQKQKSKIIPCYVYDGKWNNYQPCLIKNPDEKARVMDFMNGKAKTPYLD